MTSPAGVLLSKGKVMRSLFLAMLAFLLISGLALSHCWAVEQTEQTSNSLSKYLHQRRLPLVEARVIPSPGGTRTLLLYGFVATELGKQDAENQALDFLADPDIEITNLIKITPELMGLNSSNNGAALVSSDASTTDQSATDKSTAELGSLGDENAADSPAAIADREAYASQALNNELLLSNGTIPVFSPTLILGSRAFVQPSFIYYAYCFPHTLSHVALYPPVIVVRPAPVLAPISVSRYPAGSVVRPLPPYLPRFGPAAPPGFGHFVQPGGIGLGGGHVGGGHFGGGHR